MNKFIVVVVGLLAVSCAIAAPCDDMVAYGMPIVRSKDSTLLCRRMYVLEHNNSRHTAFWSAEHLLGSQQGIASDRINAFKADPDLPKESAAKLSDYSGSHMDKGHLSPVGDMHSDKKAMIESFYLSNMVPQLPENNRVGWRFLEGYVRDQAIKRHEIFVITGPIYQGNDKTIGASKVAVPSHIYKIIYDPRTNEALSFVVPNIPVTWPDLVHFVSDIPTVEQLTDIQFFPKSAHKIQDSNIMW